MAIGIGIGGERTSVFHAAETTTLCFLGVSDGLPVTKRGGREVCVGVCVCVCVCVYVCMCARGRLHERACLYLLPL